MRHAFFRMPGVDAPARVMIAESPLERMRGLLGRDSLPLGELMLLDPCGAVHTFGMRFALDVIFLDKDWRVVKVRAGLKPGRFAWGGFRARRTLEASAGHLPLPPLGAVVEPANAEGV